jgi:hypothetical protein
MINRSFFHITDQVKIAERVQLNEIPLPDMPAEPGKILTTFEIKSYICFV